MRNEWWERIVWQGSERGMSDEGGREKVEYDRQVHVGVRKEGGLN